VRPGGVLERMHRSAASRDRLRGDLRLLHHLATLERALEDRPPARARLEAQVGPHLAGLLRAGLTSPARLAA